MQHRKHNKLARPATGEFARHEWAIMGTQCGLVERLAQAVAGRLTGLRTAYVDADHHAGETPENPFFLQYSDKISFQRVDVKNDIKPWQRRQWFTHADLALVNGNHFTAARQILALDRRKFDSLQRKTDRLTRVELLLVRSSDDNFAQASELPESVQAAIPNWSSLPVLDFDDTDAICAFIQQNMPVAAPEALILTGGKSVRMGTDKARIEYHGRPQWQHLLDMMRQVQLSASISCRSEQTEDYNGARIITDTFLDLGPMGALLSAFRQQPDTAWLVCACDLPLLDSATLTYLLTHRDPRAIATAFRAPDGSGLPEPLIAIWEPHSYPVLLQFLAQGISCPRKVLIQAGAALLDAPEPNVLQNVNTPEEKAGLYRAAPDDAQTASL